MSAVAPLPKPEPEPHADADGWALLEGLRRRLDDQQVSQRATQTQVTQLAESIGALVELQRRRVRGLNLNSFVAYLIFTMLIGGGAYLLFRTRASELVDARDRAATERDVATKRADDATAKLAAHTDAEAKVWEVYELLETGKRADAKAKLAALAALPLTRTERAVLDARAHESQVSEVEGALKAAAASFKAGRYNDVIAPLTAALATEPAGTRASQMRYYLGVAYAKANDLDKSIAMLTAVTDADQEDARFQLASALDRKGDFVRARAEYDRFATAHPQSPLAVFAMRRSATLAHPPAVIAPIVPKPIAPAPAKPVVAPETTRGEAMSTLPEIVELPETQREQTMPMSTSPTRKKKSKPTAPAQPTPSPLPPAPTQPSPPTAPCTGSCVELPQPPKVGAQPAPSPWLPPMAPEKPEPAPQPGPKPEPIPEPRPF
jgi:tetratricopeptide (TPR) repeat protein